MHTVCHDFSKPLNRNDVFCRSLEKFSDIVETCCQQFSRFLTNMRNPQCKQQTGKVILLAAFNAVQQILCRFFPHPFNLGKLLHRQRIQVSR